MLFSNTDLYKGEWLDLVFKNRNHSYGAYTLRRENDNLMLKIASGMFISFALFGVTMTVIAKTKTIEPVYTQHIVDIPLPDDKVYDIEKPKEIEKPKTPKTAEPPKQVAAQSVQTQIFVEPKPVPDKEVIDYIEPLKADVAVASVENTEGAKGQVNATPGKDGKEPGDGAEGLPTGDDGGYVEAAIVQVMPEPVGGMEAWNKFLQKYLRYPAAAQENGISGKTFMSFIIEKDGSISNIEVLRKAGNGFDEESTRVLKLAKPWKPGMQNGKAVRVRYVLPVNFQVEAN